MRDLLRHLTDALEAGRELLLCQVVETKGSTPQKAALMIVDPDGGQVGTLGGGCVEAEVKQKAIRRIGASGVAIHAFVLDHDYAWDDGLICGGKMVISVEAIRGADAGRYFHEYRRLLDAGNGFTEAIVIDPERLEDAIARPIGARLLFDPEGTFVAGWPATDNAGPVAERVSALATRPRPGVRSGVALLPTLPRIRLIIVGAGHVGQAVAELAAGADFDVRIVDDRAQYANRERFPSAERIIVGPFDELFPALDVNTRTYGLIVTRGHGHDEEALEHLVDTEAPYIGLIGSKRKIKLIFDSLRSRGVTEERLARVSAPVGFDIGSQTVPEIAVSIVAELIARRNLGASRISMRETNWRAGQAARPSAVGGPWE